MIYVLSVLMARWGKSACMANGKWLPRILYTARRESSDTINFTRRAAAQPDHFRDATKMIGSRMAILGFSCEGFLDN